MGKANNLNTRLPAKKSQAMFFVLFIMAVLGALSGGLAVMLESEIRTRASDSDGIIALYLAQAGIERAKTWAQNNPGSNYPPGPIVWFNLGGGRYTFTVVAGLPLSAISSVGQVRDASLNILAERQLNASINAAGTAQIPWTWREQ